MTFTKSSVDTKIYPKMVCSNSMLSSIGLHEYLIIYTIAKFPGIEPKKDIISCNYDQMKLIMKLQQHGLNLAVMRHNICMIIVHMQCCIYFITTTIYLVHCEAVSWSPLPGRQFNEIP